VAKKIRLYEDVGDILKQLRTERRPMSQREAAEALNMTVHPYQVLESGESLPRVSVVIKIAEVYNIVPYLIFQARRYMSPSEEARRAADIERMARDLNRALKREKRAATGKEREFLDFAKEWREGYEAKLRYMKERGETNRPLEDVKRWLDEFWEKASSDDRTWLIVQLKRTFPEYDEWMKDHGGAEDQAKG
jgi:transcriptional regulator with XRE-family HTH domain